LSILSQAAQVAPEDPTVRNALGFAYLAKGHLAFAEQAFRKQLEQQPDSFALRALIADLVRRQGRAAEAADEAAPLLERENVSPGLQRVVGELEVEAGRPERAIAPLKAAFAAMPNDLRTLRVLVEAWRRSGAVDDARDTLDVAIAATPENDDLWRARLVFEPFAEAGALAVVERWLDARPDHIPPLQARAAIHDHAGESDEAEAIAYQIAAIEPGQAQAELRIVDRLLREDPLAAVARVRDLLAQTTSEEARPLLRQLLGRCLDVAGEAAEAASTWAALQADHTSQRLPPPPLVADIGELPPLAPLPDPAPGVLWIWGPPGSLVDRIALNFDYARGPVRIDRYGPRPPTDPLQRYGTAQELIDGRLDGSFLVSQWRAALPGRGINDGQVFDWLLLWDNALLHALRPHLPEAVLLIAIRDPRDMLLEWLAFDSPQRFAFESIEAASGWLAQALSQIADLHEGDLFPHRLLKLDDIVNDPARLAAAIGQALEISLQPLPAVGLPHFAPGHWRAYAEPLAGAFAALTPVAVRLGYPET
jgi:tetratricopeptide (TPR) repeat protein